MYHSADLDQDDEGYKEEFPEDLPFWYSAPSGKLTLNARLEPGVLKYFGQTTENEKKLDKYISDLILSAVLGVTDSIF